MIDNCCVFNFLQRSVDGKHLMCFQSEISVYKFHQLVGTGPQEPGTLQEAGASTVNIESLFMEPIT